MSFEDVANRMQERHGVPPDDRGRAEVEAQFGWGTRPIPTAVVVPPGATTAPTPAANQRPLESVDSFDAHEVMLRFAREEQRRAAKSDMLVGGLLCLFGVVITAVTFSSASESGGTYVVAWGPAIFGAIRFFRGLSRLA